MLEWRLKCFRAWQKMKEPEWAFINYPPINYQEILELRPWHFPRLVTKL